MIPAAAQFRAHYPELEMPVTNFVGAGDKIVDPESHSARLHAELPHSALVIPPDAGHMVHYAVADRIADSIDVITGGGPRSLSSSHGRRRNVTRRRPTQCRCYKVIGGVRDLPDFRPCSECERFKRTVVQLPVS
ncbi:MULTISPECIES: alpha/beta fold hydrolase [unclassified Caballeronia]|uniref:alpha/beta fold hydrolase n=1 Tax=unclassified Caballeronia TaxID=2646786 RepID=UPI003857C5E5